jgi:hypothetical protein
MTSLHSFWLLAVARRFGQCGRGAYICLRLADVGLSAVLPQLLELFECDAELAQDFKE